MIVKRGCAKKLRVNSVDIIMTVLKTGSSGVSKGYAKLQECLETQ
jgi:hypothetical protein